MSYEIKSNPDIKLSPWPLRTREGIDKLASGEEVEITKGSSIVDYVRKVYGVQNPPLFSANFSFLNRDSSDRTYVPEEVDPFVFKSLRSLDAFHKDAHMLLGHLVEEGKALGIESKTDEDREVEVLDTEELVGKLTDGSDGKKLTTKEKDVIFNDDARFIVSNEDIIKKAAVVRGVLPGWWAVSYRGKTSNNPQLMRRAVDILIHAMGEIMKSKQYKQTYEETLADQGDPLDTAVGYNLYSANMDKAGNPIGKLEVLDQFKNLKPDTANSWDDILARIVAAGRNDFDRNFPLAISPIRRLQPGYKWQHVWDRSATGLSFRNDVRGVNTMRVAWAAPYIFNLMISPIHSMWKAIRKSIPGTYHDGPTRLDYLAQLKELNPLLLESDYSNYDRSIPNDVMSYFFYKFTRMLKRSDYWLGALSQTHRNLWVLWGIQPSNSRGSGVAFKADILGLLSGLKITAEVGTFMTLLMNMAGWLETGYMSDKQILKYLLSKMEGSDELPKVFIQSDDTLLVGRDVKEIARLAHSFVIGSQAAGIEAQTNVGDKFLMRHMSKGKDMPVITRGWQNTLSNEEPESDALIMVVGFLMRSEGYLGQRTFDPFNVGHVIPTNPIEVKYTIKVLESISGFTSTAAHPIPELNDAINLLIAAGKRMVDNKMNELDALSLTSMRKRILEALAFRESRAFMQQASTNKKMATMLYQLHKDSNSPSSAWRLKMLTEANADAKNVLEEVQQKESFFYRFAMKKIGCSLFPDP